MKPLIRTYQKQIDQDAVLRMLRAGVRVPEAILVQSLQGEQAWVYDDGAVRGVATRSGRSVGLYVDREHRGRGIGGRLWEQVRGAAPVGGTLFVRHLAADQPFFGRRGVLPVVDIHLMGYRGPALPEPALPARPYEDDDFAEYIRINNAAFYELRREAGVPPLVYPEGSEGDSALRAGILRHRESIWMVDGVGLIQCDGDYIETIAVDPACQGRGYGAEMTRFAISRLKERGVDEVLLDVGAPNLRARRLYERLGFSDLQVMALGRLDAGSGSPSVV